MFQKCEFHGATAEVGELNTLEHKTLITVCIFAVSSKRNPGYTSAKPPPWIGYLLLDHFSHWGHKVENRGYSVDGMSILLSGCLDDFPFNTDLNSPTPSTSSVSKMVVRPVTRAQWRLSRIVSHHIGRCSGWTSPSQLCARAPIVDIFFSGCSLPPRYTDNGREICNRKFSRSAVRWTTWFFNSVVWARRLVFVLIWWNGRSMKE